MEYIHQLKNQQSETEGTGFTTLVSLAKNFNKLLNSSIIVFDGDVKTQDLNGIKDKNLYCTLPDKDEAAIERRLALYILNLEPDDEFFKKLHEKDIFLNDLSTHKIPLDTTQIINKSKLPTNLFKSWLKKYNKTEVKKMIELYVKNSNSKEFDQFILDFKTKINEKFKTLGIKNIDVV